MEVLKGLFALLVVSQASAQTNPPCAGKPFTRIAVMEGRWSVDWNNRVAPGQYERSAARSHIESVIPRCALLERFTGAVQGNPFWGTALLTVSATDTARRVWIDSGHGEPLLFDGGWMGDTLALNWSHDLGNRVLRLRHLYFDIKPGSFRTATYLSTVTGSPWELVGEASYQRERP